MNTLDRVMLHISEATYHYEKASRILLEYAEAENERLRHALNSTRQTTQTDAPSVNQTRLDDGKGVEPNGADRAKVVDLEFRRSRARDGIPQELRDII